MADLKCFRVDTASGESCWVVTDTPEKALAAHREYLGHDEDDELETIVIEPDDKPLRINADDEDSERTLTCAEWVKRNGEGFLCTTCY